MGMERKRCASLQSNDVPASYTSLHAHLFNQSPRNYLLLFFATPSVNLVGGNTLLLSKDLHWRLRKS